uniref:Uncharacterized protein n=1 Tax=Ascaris lumbricoides TaxID=6252 RepID=A0A0M3IQH4_ASCLU
MPPVGKTSLACCGQLSGADTHLLKAMDAHIRLREHRTDHLTRPALDEMSVTTKYLLLITMGRVTRSGTIDGTNDRHYSTLAPHEPSGISGQWTCIINPLVMAALKFLPQILHLPSITSVLCVNKPE